MLKVGVIGLGPIGNRHARIYQDDPLAELVAVCDKDRERADQAHSAYGVPAYYDVEDMLSRAKPDLVSVATGGSIPLVNALHEAVPDAEILLLGATDGFSNIHAPNERVLLAEFGKTVLAEADFFREYAERWKGKRAEASR